jgi:carboxylesterase type B
MFGGDPKRVTIAGESAGGGSVMLQTLAYGGQLGNSLFTNIIAASPYLPMQYNYNAFVPSQSYYAFAQAVGCLTGPFGHSNATVFQCLQGMDTETLQNASNAVSQADAFGQWGFLPVTDGIYIQQRPSHQLLEKKINGQHILVGMNANEGAPFVPQPINTEDDFVTYIRQTFPLFKDSDISKTLMYYPSTNASVSANAIDFATNGVDGATALNESTVASGQQQRADNLYAETTFNCPGYWLSEAFSDGGRSAYRYADSVIPALHGEDVAGYFGPRTPQFGVDFEYAWMKIWGNFITKSNPSISNAVANGASSNSTAFNPASNWPRYTIANPYQINLNQTGSTPTTVAVGGKNITELTGDGLRNAFTLANAYTWEGGRGMRCDFWRSVAAVVPE